MNAPVTPKIRTENIFPPIPVRQFDWSAVFEDYEPGSPIGYGRTEQVLDELRLILRWMRFTGKSGQFPAIVARVGE